MSALGILGAAGIGMGADLIGSHQQQKFNAREAQKQRDWQTDMSNTAYQRAATDLEAAGLNRVIALGSPASTPSGATASIEAPKLGATGVAAASAKAQIEQTQAQAKLTKAMEKTEIQKEKTEEQKARLTKSEAEKAALFKEPMEHFAPLVNSTAKGAAEFTGKVTKAMGHRVDELKDIFETVKQAPAAAAQASQKAKSKLKSLWDFLTLKYKN